MTVSKDLTHAFDPQLSEFFQVHLVRDVSNEISLLRYSSDEGSLKGRSLLYNLPDFFLRNWIYQNLTRNKS